MSKPYTSLDDLKIKYDAEQNPVTRSVYRTIIANRLDQDNKDAAKKVHKFVLGPDYRQHGQTEHEFYHTAACGYVRDNVTTNNDDVTCLHCLKWMANGNR